jgi:hypothetical protein
MKKYFNVKISYERKDIELASVKRIVENYLVECERVDDVKEVIERELNGYDDIAIEAISRAKISDTIISDDNGAFFKCTLVFIVENDETKALRKAKEVFVVKAENIKDAYDTVTEAYARGSLSETFLRSISEMNIIDVIQR